MCECLGNGSGEWHCDHIDMCEYKGILYMPEEKWTSTHDDGHRMICTCLGHGNGKWMCHAMSYCVALIGNKKEHVLAGESWIATYNGIEKKCICDKSKTIRCEPTRKSKQLKIDVTSIPAQLLPGGEVDLECDYGNPEATQNVIVKWIFEPESSNQKEQIGYFNSVQGYVELKDKTRSSLTQRGRVLNINMLTPSDTGVYYCHVDVDWDQGTNSVEIDVDDHPIIFSSSSTHQSTKSYTLAWRPNNDFTSRATSWQVRWRQKGHDWSKLIDRDQEQMFFTVSSSEFRPNAEYEFELTSVRRGRIGPVYGKKNYLIVRTEESKLPPKSVMTTQTTTIFNTAATTFFTTAGRIVVGDLGEISVKPFAKAAHLAWKNVPGTTSLQFI